MHHDAVRQYHGVLGRSGSRLIDGCKQQEKKKRLLLDSARDHASVVAFHGNVSSSCLTGWGLGGVCGNSPKQNP